MAQDQENHNLILSPKKPLLRDIFPQNLLEWPSKVEFSGWLLPQKKWKLWVEYLSPKYAAVWKQAGIYNAIMSTTYEVPRNHELVLGLSEFWSPKTNTFVFPWGEATITLEDIMVLGGFPVLGEPVKTLLDDKISKIEMVLVKEKVEMCRSKGRKASYSTWMNHFMDKDGELEHLAFLSLWLASYVFPSLSESVRNHVFPIAIRLSRGTKVALAPAVLAMIYRDLRVITEGVLESKEIITISGPFHLMQLWAFERLSLLGPKFPNSLKIGEPRIARWHELSPKVNNLPLIRSALSLEGIFEWRSYATDLVNWQHLPYYEEAGRTRLLGKWSLDDKLRGFFVCLRTCNLVGFDCEEKYYPHRVAMQFGLDQDLPYDPTKFGFTLSYTTMFVVPPRVFRSCASNRYATWWNNMMVNRRKVLECVLKEDRYAKIIKECRCLVALGDRVNPLYSEKRKSRDVDGRAGTGKKVKTEENFLDKEPIDIDKLEEDVLPSKKGGKSCKGMARKRTRAGLTVDNPIDVDNPIECSTRKPHKPEQDIEERVATLEKIIFLFIRNAGENDGSTSKVKSDSIKEEHY